MYNAKCEIGNMYFTSKKCPIINFFFSQISSFSQSSLSSKRGISPGYDMEKLYPFFWKLSKQIWMDSKIKRP